MIEIHVHAYIYIEDRIMISSGDPTYNDCITILLPAKDVIIKWDDDMTYAIMPLRVMEKYITMTLL
jgi:hypothetical protein